MAQPKGKNESNRRDVLKGLGIGALGFPLMMGTTTAKQTSCNLNVRVEAGEGTLEDWIPREQLTDEFKAKIDASGVSGTHLVYMLAVLDPENKLAAPRTGTVEIDSSWSSVEIVAGPWRPGGLINNWQNGMYHIYTTVIDDQGSMGGAVSREFEIST